MKLVFSELIILLPIFKPNYERLKIQVGSIVNQHFQDWQLLLLDDDPDHSNQTLLLQFTEDHRIKLLNNNENLGLYKSIEHHLSLIEGMSNYVALSDQDDMWFENKLDLLINNIAEHQVIYADSKVVNSKSEIIYDSFYTKRSNHYHELENLFLVNTLQGSNCLFRNSFIKKLIPFPSASYRLMHDHYIALIAHLDDSLGFLNEPTMQYIQHEDNKIGYTEMKKSNFYISYAQIFFLKIKLTSNRLLGPIFNLEANKKELQIYHNKKNQYAFLKKRFPHYKDLNKISYYLNPATCDDKLKLLMKKNRSKKIRINYAEVIIIKSLLIYLKNIK